MIVKTQLFLFEFLHHHRLTLSIATVDNSSARVRDLLKSCIAYILRAPYIHIK